MARDVTQSDLIAAVQQKPELWDPEYPRYSDRVQKKKAWAEVYKCLIPNWDLLSTKQKDNRGKDLSTRWRSLRDRYRRELTEERLSVQSGAPIRTKKRHPYARELAFLRRAMETRETTSNMAAEEEESEAGPSNPRTVAESEETSHSAPCRLQVSLSLLSIYLSIYLQINVYKLFFFRHQRLYRRPDRGERWVFGGPAVVSRGHLLAPMISSFVFCWKCLRGKAPYLQTKISSGTLVTRGWCSVAVFYLFWKVFRMNVSCRPRKTSICTFWLSSMLNGETFHLLGCISPLCPPPLVQVLSPVLAEPFLNPIPTHPPSPSPLPCPHLLFHQVPL